MKVWSSITVLFLGLFITSCDSGQPAELDDILRTSMRVQANPYHRVPLGALLTFSTEEECIVEIEVRGDIPINRKFQNYTTSHSIPVLGLYPDTTNIVDLTLTSRSGKTYLGVVELKTAPLPDFFPTISITQLDKARMEPGMHLIEMLIANNGKFLSYTIIFDDNGDIRWFMDLSEQGQITYTALRLRNGNWFYLNWIDMFEYSDLGEEIDTQQMWNFAGNHDITELGNGNLLMGGSQKEATVIREGKPIETIFDFAVEWNLIQRRPVKGWDVGEVLDVDRSVYPEDYSLDFDADWFHVNSVEVSQPDRTIIISGRSQGVLKVDMQNNLKWILAPNRGWGRAGRDRTGHNTSEFVLTAVDSTGKQYPPEVQRGDTGTEDFEWSTGQHAITLLDNGNILLFDNGLYRNFTNKHTYSRAVEYKIDEENMTVQQVWQYGKSRGLEMHSPITSDVDVLPRTGNRLITAGNIRVGTSPHAKLIEITYPDNQVVFESEIHFKDALGTGEKTWAQFDLVFKGERYQLFR